MKIEVTQDDINNGCIHRIKQCPVALAINRVLAEGCQAFVYGAVISIQTSNGLEIFSTLTPAIARNFIKIFDKSEDVSPFTFDLDIPDCLEVPN